MIWKGNGLNGCGNQTTRWNGLCWGRNVGSDFDKMNSAKEEVRVKDLKCLPDNCAKDLRGEA